MSEDLPGQQSVADGGPVTDGGPVADGGPVTDAPGQSRPRRRRRPSALVVADLVTMAIGIALIVVDSHLHQPVTPSQGFIHARSTSNQIDGTKMHWVGAVGVFLILFYGLVAFAHVALGKPRRRPRRGWIIAVLVFLTGCYLILSSLVVTGIIGERADATGMGDCHKVPNLAYSSDWYACDLSVRWPDGSTATVAAVPISSDDHIVTLAKPKFHAWPFAGDEHRYKVGDLIALLSLGVVFVGRSLFRVVLLLVGYGRGPDEAPSDQ